MELLTESQISFVVVIHQMFGKFNLLYNG